METALAAHGFSGAATLVPTTSREAVPLLCSLDKYIDLMIPRGGHGLVETVVKHARMPVIKHYNGICHAFVHRDADFDMAEKIILNAKCQRPSACNAMETLLVDAAIAPAFVPRIVAALRAAKVEIHADADSRNIVPDLNLATAADWDTEYLDFVLNLRVVDGTPTAIAHIAEHGSQHSDTIVTENIAEAEFFLNAVDSAAVYWNASTRFTDGGEFGFGAEIGISTGKLHARGPMGLEELTSYKYQILGKGQVRG
jgi:glutamate-5-semialdehyde dehydrogenase